MSKPIKSNTCILCTNKSSCFEKLSPIELELSDSNRVELHFNKGETVAKQGSFTTHILFLQKGLVKVYREVSKGNNLIINIFSGGNLIGLPSLYGDDFLQYSVAAIEDSVVCAIDKKIFEQLIMENGAFAAAIVNTINKCSLHIFDKLENLTQRQLNGKFANALLFLADEVFKSDSFMLSLSRKELAEFTGTSVMSIVRVMKEFQQDKLIAESKGRLEILDKQKLIQIGLAG